MAASSAAWLLRDGVVLASVEVARGRRARRRGLLGREGIEGVLLIPRCRAVHTIGMRFAIDVAFCDAGGTVVHLETVPPGRLVRPVWRARQVIEAPAGAFERWGLALGDRLEIG